MEGPTPGRLALLIDSSQAMISEKEESGQKDGIITFAHGHPGWPPLFLIPAIGGGAFIYRELVSSLNIPNPIYALEAPGLWNGGPPLNNVEDLADHFLRTIKETCPSGEFHLVGSSFGGMVAFEMARRLSNNGTPPLQTILIDSPGPEHLPRSFNSDDEVFAYLLAGDDPDKGFELNLNELRKLPQEERLNFVARKLGDESEDSSGLSVEEMASIVAVYKANIKAMFAYTPQPFDGKLIFFKATEANSFMARHPELAWVPLAKGGIEIIPTLGNHANMLSLPHAEKLGAAIKNRCSARINGTCKPLVAAD